MERKLLVVRLDVDLLPAAVIVDPDHTFVRVPAEFDEDRELDAVGGGAVSDAGDDDPSVPLRGGSATDEGENDRLLRSHHAPEHVRRELDRLSSSSCLAAIHDVEIELECSTKVFGVCQQPIQLRQRMPSRSNEAPVPPTPGIVAAVDELSTFKLSAR